MNLIRSIDHLMRTICIYFYNDKCVLRVSACKIFYICNINIKDTYKCKVNLTIPDLCHKSLRLQKNTICRLLLINLPYRITCCYILDAVRDCDEIRKSQHLKLRVYQFVVNLYFK